MNKKRTIIFLAGTLLVAACNNAPTNTNSTVANTNTGFQRTDNSLVVSSHSKPQSTTSQSQTSTQSSTTSTSGNSPMTKAVDVSEMTADIEKAEKAYQAKTGDAKLKDELAEAYFRRAFALTGAAQYRAALGDFRKGLKLKPDAKEAKDMHDQIIDIFKSINREPPKEGEEPPPMPINK
jgi:hypothetical protein